MSPAASGRAGAARYAAPAAFLLGVTIAVLLIRSALGGGDGGATTTTFGPVTRPASARTTTRQSASAPVATTVAAAQYYTVQTGDTFGSIAAAHGVAVTDLETLNPGVSSNALQVGQRLRVK